jgi:hypothetical protein
LAALLAMLSQIEPKWQKLKSQLTALTDAAVEFRYPNNWATSLEARESYATCRRLRALARTSFGLKP